MVGAKRPCKLDPSKHIHGNGCRLAYRTASAAPATSNRSRPSWRASIQRPAPPMTVLLFKPCGSADTLIWNVSPSTP